MSYEFISQSSHKARKDYYCDACDSMNQDLSFYFHDMTFSEKKEFVKAKKNNFHILKGEKYSKQVGKFDGEFTTSRCIPEIEVIAIRLDVWGNI